jgi:hypothetical protein
MGVLSFIVASKDCGLMTKLAYGRATYLHFELAKWFRVALEIA